MSIQQIAISNTCVQVIGKATGRFRKVEMSTNNLAAPKVVQLVSCTCKGDEEKKGVVVKRESVGKGEKEGKKWRHKEGGRNRM